MGKVRQFVRVKLFCSNKRGIFVLSVSLSVIFLLGLMFTPEVRATAQNVIQSVKVENTSTDPLLVTVNNETPIPESFNSETTRPIVISKQQQEKLTTVGISDDGNTVKLDPASSVQVTNTVAHPLIVNVNNDSKRQSYSVSVKHMDRGAPRDTEEGGPKNLSIPAEKRFVVESLSMKGKANTGSKRAIEVKISSNTQLKGVFQTIVPFTPWPSDFDIVSANYPFKVDIQSDDVVQVYVTVPKGSSYSSFDIWFNGYFEDVN